MPEVFGPSPAGDVTAFDPYRHLLPRDLKGVQALACGDGLVEIAEALAARGAEVIRGSGGEPVATAFGDETAPPAQSGDGVDRTARFGVVACALSDDEAFSGRVSRFAAILKPGGYLLLLFSTVAAPGRSRGSGSGEDLSRVKEELGSCGLGDVRLVATRAFGSKAGQEQLACFFGYRSGARLVDAPGSAVQV